MDTSGAARDKAVELGATAAVDASLGSEHVRAQVSLGVHTSAYRPPYQQQPEQPMITRAADRSSTAATTRRRLRAHPPARYHMYMHMHMHWTGAAADGGHRCGACHRRGRLQGHLRGCCVERAQRRAHGPGRSSSGWRAAGGADGARRRAGDRDHRRASMVRVAVLAAAEHATTYGSRYPPLSLPSRSSCVSAKVDQRALLAQHAPTHALPTGGAKAAPL